MFSHQTRFLGGIFGLAVGDALGVPVEFQSRQQIARAPVTGMRGFGTHNQPPGTWSDDTSMALCLLQGLAERQDLAGIQQLFVDWARKGLWTPYGEVFDIGCTTSAALYNAGTTADPRDAGLAEESSNGNGSLMRTLPLPLMRPGLSTEALAELSHDISCLTHAHPRSQMGCGIFNEFVRRVYLGQQPAAAWEGTRTWAQGFYRVLFPGELRHYAEILARDARQWSRLDASRVRGNGYVVSTLGASLWAFFSTSSYRDCVLAAVNLGEDTDTTGAVAGGLAGVAYGLEAIPKDWLEALARREEIEALCRRALVVCAEGGGEV